MEQAERTRAPTHPLIRSDRVEGTPVYAADGSRIGKIKHLEIEKVSGQVVYAITCFNALWAIRADTHTIPWSKLTYDPQLHGFRTDTTRNQLRTPPESSRAENSDGPKEKRSAYTGTGIRHPMAG